MRERLNSIKQTITKIQIPAFALNGNWKWYLFWIGVTELVGITSGLLTARNIMIFSRMTINKPPLYPNPIVFPLVWTLLYALMGIGITRILFHESSGDRMLSVLLYFIQLIFNFAWTFIFFGAQKYGVSLFWLFTLLILVLMMTSVFDSVDKIASLLQIPYIIWLFFAVYLNAGFWLLNTQ